MGCPAGGPPHITLLDMGAVTHIAALHTPQRSTLYPVVSTDHMDVALITLQPGQVRWGWLRHQADSCHEQAFRSGAALRTICMPCAARACAPAVSTAFTSLL